MRVQLAKGSFSTLEFLESWLDVLAMFAPEAQLITMKDALTHKTEVNDSCLRQLLGASGVCRALFAKEGMKAGYRSWLVRVKADLESLVHNELEEQEILNYKQVHRTESGNLEAAGISSFEQLSMACDFLGNMMSKMRLALSDEWRLPSIALLTTVAVSNNQVDRVPWEVMAFGEDEQVVDHMSSLAVPASYCKQMGAVRKQVNRLLDGVTGLPQMEKALAPHVKGLLDTYPDFELDLHWLKHHAQPVVQEKAHSLILGMFPDHDKVGMTEKMCHAKLQAQ